MGVVYKVKEEVVQFIIGQKKSNPTLSCRKLVNLIEEKFETKVSKSSVNNVIKAHSLSAPVGRTPKKMSKEDNFKIPSTRKEELFKEAKRYIDIVKPDVENKPAVEVPKIKTTDDQIREEEIRAKMEAKIAPPSPLTRKPSVEPPPRQKIFRPEEIDQSNNTANKANKIVTPDLNVEEKAHANPTPSQKFSNSKPEVATPKPKKVKKLAWVEIDDIDRYDTSLRPDPTEEKTSPKDEHKEATPTSIKEKNISDQGLVQERTSTDQIDVFIDEPTMSKGLAYSNLGFMLFKCAQWDLMRQRPLVKALENKLHSRRENEYTTLSDWLLTAPLFGYQDLFSLKGRPPEEERMINQYHPDVDLIAMVQQFSKLEDAFGFAMSLQTEMIMNLTQVKHIKVTLNNGNIFYLDPRLTGAYESEKVIKYGAPLSRSMEDIPDALINNIRPMILRDMDGKALVSFMSFMYAQPNYHATSVEVVGFNNEVLVNFDEPSQQPRQFMAAIRNDKKFELTESFKHDFYGIEGKCAQQMTQVGNFNLRQIQFQMDNQAKHITLVTNIDLSVEMKDIVFQWVMRYMAADGLKFQSVNISMPNLMDLSDTNKSLFNYVNQITQTVFDYMCQAYFPDQKMTLGEFISKYSHISGLLRQDNERCDIFLKINDKKSPLLHAMKLINAHQIYDYAGRIVYIFPQMN